MCEKCLSRTNCQFLAKHKKAVVEDCTAFRDEEEYVAKIKTEAIKEFAERVKNQFDNLEYCAKTPRKTVKVDELREQVDWILHTIVPQTIDQITKEMEKK